jgi:hypothetical protein
VYYLAQAGTTLKLIKSDGTVQSITLPAGVVIDGTRRAVIAVLNGVVYIVYSPSQTLWFDPGTLTLRNAHILPPISAPTLAAGSGTGLTGSYKVKVSFAVKDDGGRIINESPLCAGDSGAFAASNNSLLVSNIPISPDANVNCRRIYRTVAGGSAYFAMLDIADNATTSVDSSISDASLSLLPADPSIGNPPGAVPGTSLKNVIAWKNRLWGVPEQQDSRDQLIYTEDGIFYAWNPDNNLKIYPVGQDLFGITGLLSRRDSLGVCKRDRLIKIVGSSNADFQQVIVVEGMGCVARESCLVVRDVGYFLGIDGFYRWDDGGVVKISGPDVDPWFTTDTYFNRTKFPDAIAAWNPFTNAIEIQLAAAGSSTLDRWVAFHLDQQKWLGPHKTAAFTATARALLQADSGAYTPAIGGDDGYIYLQNNPTSTDVSGAGASSAIAASLRTKFHAGNPPAPNIEHFFGRLGVLSRVETGGTLTITPYLGGVDAAAAATLSADLTLGRQQLDRVGTGRMCSLQFDLATVGRAFLLYGYEMDPVFELGLR